MKRVLSLFLAVSMIVILFTACGQKDDSTRIGDDIAKVENPEGEGKTSDETKKEEPAWKTKEIELVMWDYPPDGPQKELALATFKEFEEEYPNIKVEHKLFQPEPGADRVEFTTAMAGGNGPNAYQSAHFTVIKPWIKQGFCYPLDEYLNEWEETEFLQKGPLKIATEDGKIYGLPYDMSPIVLAYRVDLYKEAGLDPGDPPKTWDEYVQYAKALTNAEKGQYGISLLGNDTADWWFQYYVWQAGGEITTIESDGTVKLHITEQPAIDALQFYKDLKWKHKVIQPDILMDFGAMAQDFCIGKSAQMLFIPGWLDWWTSSGLKVEDLGLAQLPEGPTGIKTTSVSGTFYIINPNTTKDERDATWEYIKFVKSREKVIEGFKTSKEANIQYPVIPMYSDIDITDYLDIPESWAKAASDAIFESREEYYLVEQIRPLLVPAIQHVLLNENSDPKTELEKVAETIEEEVIKPYNNSVK